MPIAIILLFFSAIVLLAMAFPDIRSTGLRSVRATEFWIPASLTLWPTWVLMTKRLMEEIEIPQTLWFAAQTAPALVLAAVHIGLRLFSFRGARTTVGIGAMTVALLVLATTVAATFTDQSWQHGILALQLALAVGLAGVRRWQAVIDGIVGSVLAMVVSAAAYGVIFPAAFRTDCHDNFAKCELLGGFVSVGGGSGSNAFGITLAMLGGVLVYVFPRLRGALAGVAIGVAILATGARLATVCAAAVFALAWFSAHMGWARRLLPLGAGGFGLLSIITAAWPFPENAFTDRAVLWERARVMIADHPFFGHGLSYWARDAITQTNPSDSYAPHNLWLDPLVAVGFMGTAVLVVALVISFHHADPRARAIAWVLLAGILCMGTFESTVMPFRIGPIPACFPVLLLLLTASQRPRESQGRRET